MIGAAARAGAANADLAEKPFMARKITFATVLHMPASIRPIAMPTSASVDEPPPNTSMEQLSRSPRAPAMKVEKVRIARLVGQHAVDVGVLQPGILDRVAHRPGASEARGSTPEPRV